MKMVNRYVLIAAKKVVMSPIHAINVRWLCIATPHVKRNIDQNIRNSVRDEWLSCMIKNYSNNLLQKKKIVRFVFYVCPHLIRGGDIRRVVGNSYAVDACMHFNQGFY